ncbi:MAG: hypothetical protein VXY93_13600, partial [Pseudomonadota bacterium]|nr:hypothetical protein [Pseudomonadota bacterium]
TNLIGVDKIEVTTAGTNVAVAVTQNGTGDLVRLYDGTSQVVTVDDEGQVGLGSAIPENKFTLADGTNPLLTFRRNGSLVSGNHISYTDYKGNDTIFGRLGFWVESPGSGTSQFRVYSGTNIKMTVGAAGQVYLVNDSNTYWHHPANDTHAFTTAGDERLRITSDGKVGIGTNNPGQHLEIYGTGTTTQVEVNGTGRYRGFEIHEGGTRKAYFHHDSTDNIAMLNTAEANLQFYTGDTYRMKLDGNGDLTFKDSAAQGNSLSSKITVTDSSNNIQYEIGMLSTGNEDLYFS